MKYINIDILIGWFIEDFWKICIAFVVSAVISVVVALSIPNEYSSRAVVISNMGEGKAISGALANLGGLASMAGISLGGEEMNSEVLKEIMISNTFLGMFIQENNLAPVIMAADGFDVTSGEFNFDDSIYDPATQSWTREVVYPATPAPNATEVSEKFREKLSASYDRKNQLVTISILSYSPQFAHETLTKLVNRFNQYMQVKETEKHKKTIAYLNNQLKDAQVVEVRSAIQRVLEEQLKQLALAETRSDYAFRLLEEPTMSYKKSAPKRAVICVAITLFGTLLFIILSWSIRAFRSEDA